MAAILQNLSPEYLGFDMKASARQQIRFSLDPDWIRLPPVNLDKYAGRTRKVSEFTVCCVSFVKARNGV